MPPPRRIELDKGLAGMAGADVLATNGKWGGSQIGRVKKALPPGVHLDLVVVIVQSTRYVALPQPATGVSLWFLPK